MNLRAPEKSDIDRMYLWENDPEGWLDAASRAPVSRQQLWNYIESYDGDPLKNGEGRFVIDRNGETVGAVDLTSIDLLNRRAEVSIVIDPSLRRKGLALETLNLLADYCRIHLGLHQLYAIVRVGNEPSRRLFEAAGYKISGRLRSWVRHGEQYSDAYLLQRLLVV